jgi:hypothetical protein
MLLAHWCLQLICAAAVCSLTRENVVMGPGKADISIDLRTAEQAAELKRWVGLALSVQSAQSHT